MPLSPELAARFEPRVRARGEEYQRAGRVRIVEMTDTSVAAVVRGAARYDVVVRRGRGATTLACSCPYAEEWAAPCKHLWATLLEADRLGFNPNFEASAGVHAPPDGVATVPRAPRLPRWKRELQRLRQALPPAPADPERDGWPAGKRLVYVVDVPASLDATQGLVVELATQAPRREGGWGPAKRFAYSAAQWLAAPDPADREIAQMLVGAQPEHASYAPAGTRRFHLAPAALDTTLRRMCDTGRCLARLEPGAAADLPPLAWDDREPWELALTLAPGDDAHHVLAGVLRRGEARLPLAGPVTFVAGLVLLRHDGRLVAARLRDHGASDLLAALRAGLRLEIPNDDVTESLAELYARPAASLPPLELPAALGVREVRVAPVAHLALAPTPPWAWQPDRMDAVLAFDYDGTRVARGDPAAAVVLPEARRVVHRDAAAEAAAAARLARAGFRREHDHVAGRDVLRIPTARVPRVARDLTAEGWRVEVEGRVLRTAGDVGFQVRSGIDWFDLEGVADFGGVAAPLPELLAALRRGEHMVRLGDGSLGILPEEWLARFGVLDAVAAGAGGRLRFARGQASLLDAVLASLPGARTDEPFERARAELRRFEGVVPLDAPEGFGGELRPYQREGLGWLDFLRRFGFGGCLADDMGLGKTVQALALLETRRQAGAGPSLVVVPRSLVFNWQQEAARFAPRLRVLAHGGPQRRAQLARLGEYDLVVTTYGTLRRDAAHLAHVEFDYVILDEAQAVKNAATATAKAARLLRGRHRLAMSGTPVENRLAELWSLLDWLNPGMLGAAAVFQRLVANGTTAESSALIARAVRPFILRRTKEQVARDLPPRVEQTLWVELDAAERRRYDELRDHYRASLLGLVERDGVARSRMHVLEALLRLRQAACHPGLLDGARVAEPSSKLELLLERVAEVVAEGHKAIVFSQFTSLLAIVRGRLDAGGVAYEYLDGKTRDRKQRVERFQRDPACPLFLVSLKAGGLGLNLTAADYVFLLDPWWNPAVEAQAIDRAHRIGQTRPVVAARLIARGTVEEKVLELQQTKRELADAIVGADAGLLGGLTRDDLELLLG